MRGEKLFRIPYAVEMVTGQRPNPSTCWRWRTKGVSGIRLECQYMGGIPHTSREAVVRFMEKVTEAKEAEQSLPELDIQDDKPSPRHEAAKKRLAEIVGAK